MPLVLSCLVNMSTDNSSSSIYFHSYKNIDVRVKNTFLSDIKNMEKH